MRAMILASLIAFSSVAVGAQTYQSENRLTVVPLGGSDFEVIEARGEGPRGMWCAAASFAQARLGTPRGSRIYIKQARGPSVSTAGRKGVVFTSSRASLDVPPFQSTSLSVRQKGMGLPVHHARQFCIDYLLDLQDVDP